ncbi:ABC transporter substrate-binding protein [Paenibacillus oryzisoli]|uniref:Sugar ABC transporter substrate-binding protein n=1 Tax=Paenibacillus oryzisoli TaxID=1850517 RepID=A0A198AA16_9BACL|nr:sugar ABC transporter substrate-binding protein [Paenibacillus oryzisoli]OAS17906.1 sugar ABC transporter substrate-binding protein [Paenibacillus oryzisoli]
MKKKLALVLLASTVLATACSNGNEESNASPDVNKGATTTSAAPLKGEIVLWHSFTQGPRNDYMKQAAEDFMKKNPEVKIKIETFSWGEFYTKWTTGLLSGQVPDVSTALPNHVVEMLNSEAIIPINDVIDKIGRSRFYEAPLKEGTKDGKNYSIPIYSHAQVMWYRKDLLKAANLEVPKTWNELFEAAKKVNNPPNVYGLSVPTGSGDLMATRFLNFYVKSAGETLITKDGKANLTSKAALDGIKYWVDMYRATSPTGSINFKVLDQATLFYQGKTAFDFNSGFQIGGVETNSPALLDQIDAAPMPKLNASDADRGIETSNIPMVVWKNSKHPEIAKAFIESLYEKDKYIKFLHSVPAGMLPAMKDIAEDPAFLDNPTIKKFNNAVKVIGNAINSGTAIGMENGPSVQSGIITSQNVIEMMFQDIILKKDKTSIEEEAKKAEKKLNDLFQTATK